MLAISYIFFLQLLLEVTSYYQDETKNIFYKLRAGTDLVYTSDEEIQHYERFKADLIEEGFTTELSSSRLEEIFINSRPALMQDIVDRINLKQNNWRASKGHLRFQGMSFGDMLRFYGNSKFGNKREKLLRTNFSNPVNAELPSTFDSRKGFEECAEVIGHVRDQGGCGSCAALSTVGVLNDRLCIRSKGTFKKLLSPAYVIACCTQHGICDNVCWGGASPDEMWAFMMEYGVPTGGDYTPDELMTTGSGCWPYNFPKCNHVSKGTEYTPCPKDPLPTPACSLACPNKQYEVKLQKDLHFVEAPGNVDVPTEVDAIKREILTNGSVTATFAVYEDFQHYESGVYEYTYGNFRGYHIVKLIGWGLNGKEGYWLAVNSWNEEWGEDGLFRIAFGECEIEDDVTYGNPIVEQF